VEYTISGWGAALCVSSLLTVGFVLGMIFEACNRIE